MTQRGTPPLISVQEAAERLAVSQGRLYALVRQRLLPAVRLGRSLRFDRAQLEAFVEAGGAGWPGGWRKSNSGR